MMSCARLFVIFGRVETDVHCGCVTHHVHTCVVHNITILLRSAEPMTCILVLAMAARSALFVRSYSTSSATLSDIVHPSVDIEFVDSRSAHTDKLMSTVSLWELFIDSFLILHLQYNSGLSMLMFISAGGAHLHRPRAGEH